MQYPERQNYRFEDVEVDLSRGCLLRDGEERHLRQQAFQVLVYLLDRRERLVSKNELFETVWHNTAVTDDVLVQCVTEIRRVIGDDPHHPRFIKTIPKTGYRFIGEVKENGNGQYTEEITRVEVEIEESIEIGSDDSRARTRSLFGRSSKGLYMIGGTIAVMFAAILYFGWPTTPRTTNAALATIDGRKAVAVMFFDNQSKTADLDWLREGLADMLSAGLSRSDRLIVLSRDQLHSLLARNETANTNVSVENAVYIASQSRAEYLVSGSFAQLGQSVRLDVKLHDGKTGILLTTESLTVERAEQLLSQIDILSLKISRRLGAVPSEDRDMASVMTNNLEAYRYYSIAVEKAHAFHSEEAVALLEKAIVLDPDFAMAHARIGYAYSVSAAQLEKGRSYLEKAFQLSSRLTEKDRMNIAAWYAIAHQDFAMAIESYRQIIQRFPFEIEAYLRLGRLLKGEERFDEALDVIKQGLAIDPGAAELYNSMGGILSGMGRYAEVITAQQKYVDLAPTEPNAYDSLGLAYQWVGDNERAMANFNRALEIEPKFDVALVHVANLRVRLGQYREAFAAFARYEAAATSDIGKKRAVDGHTYVYLQMNDLDAADRSAARSAKIKDDALSYEYVIAVRRGDKVKSKAREDVFRAGLALVDRGSRANQRFESYQRGLIALNNGRNDEAIEEFRKTITYAPTVWHWVDFEDSLAAAFLRMGRFDEAIGEYQRILQINPNYPRAHYYLGQAYEGLGQTDNARESYLKFLEVWSGADRDIPEILAAQKFVGS